MSIASRGATMAVDWEQRVDFPRLRLERMERAKAALAARQAPKSFDRMAARAELDELIGRLGAASA